MITKKRMAVILISLAVFTIIAVNVSCHDFLSFDTVARNWVYSRRTDTLSSIIIPITYSGNVQTVFALGVILMLWKKTRKTFGIPFAIVSISSSVCYKAVKAVFKRPRPDVAVHLIKQGGYSFPSGHSMNCLVCYGFLIYLINRHCKNKKLARILTVLLTLQIICIGLSRVYVGVHFPTDILGGWSLGLAFLTVSIIIYERVR
ncbi:MAG: phosphatase PAP2 family protein, partial [Emergencia sp.]